HPGQRAGRKPGRKKSLGAVPLLEAAFRLYGWDDESEAADTLNTSPNRVRAWRRGTERMDVADYMALTTIVSAGLADAMRAGKAGTVDVSHAAEALGVRSSAGRSD